jgi:thiol-disulfide isomerase/thioredoxin
MGKASKTKQEYGRRERIAAQREAARRAEQRNRLLIAGGAVIAVVAVVLAFILIKANTKSPTTASSAPSAPAGAALDSVISKLTSVPTSASDAVGSGGGEVTGKPETLSGGSPLTANGKPEMLYMGAEYCPYCAAERWAMIVALSRFGTFSGLATMHSAVKNGAGDAEPDPNTPTWTFDHATFTSQYLTFEPVEMYTNIPDPSTGEYTTLETPTSAQLALMNKWDAPPYVPSGDNGAFPFIDFGNKYLIAGASYDPGILAGLSWAQVATDLSNPSSKVAQGVDGTANYITAAICKLTGNTPASACTSTVQSLESSL